MFLTNKFKVPTSKSKVIYFGINFTLVGRQIADVGSQIGRASCRERVLVAV